MSPKAGSKSIARSRSRTIGRVTHYYAHASAAIVELTEGELAIGDTLHVHGHTTDFLQEVTSLRVDDRDVAEATAPALVGLKLDRPARTGDRVDRVLVEEDAPHA